MNKIFDFTKDYNIIEEYKKNREFLHPQSGNYWVEYDMYGTKIRDIARFSYCGNGAGFWEFFGVDTMLDGWTSVKILKKVDEF